jgi:hypothetical protein
LISFLPCSEFDSLPTISRFNRLIQFVIGVQITSLFLIDFKWYKEICQLPTGMPAQEDR